jgi:hypothetical protein
MTFRSCLNSRFWIPEALPFVELISVHDTNCFLSKSWNVWFNSSCSSCQRKALRITSLLASNGGASSGPKKSSKSCTVCKGKGTNMCVPCAGSGDQRFHLPLMYCYFSPSSSFSNSVLTLCPLLILCSFLFLGNDLLPCTYLICRSNCWNGTVTSTLSRSTVLKLMAKDENHWFLLKSVLSVRYDRIESIFSHPLISLTFSLAHSLPLSLSPSLSSLSLFSPLPFPPKVSIKLMVTYLRDGRVTSAKGSVSCLAHAPERRA